MFFIGWGLGCIFLSPWADKNGRKNVFLCACFLQLITWSIMIHITNIWLFYIFCFIFGVCIAGRYTVGYVMFVEMIPKPFRIKYALMIDFSEGFIITFIVVYLRFVSRNWIYL